MHLKETLELAWKSRAQIANGFYNTYLSHKPEVDAEADRRRAICESNVCGYYDKEGKPETSSVPGKPACSVCHCNISLKSACVFCWCALLDLQILKLKQINPETDTNNIELCRIQIKSLQRQGIDLGPDPLWDKIMEKDMDDNINAQNYENQFKPKQ